MPSARKLHPRKDPARRCLLPADWPEGDRRAFAAALQAGDLLEPGGAAATWSAQTRTKNAAGYGRWLTWLAMHGWLDPRAGPAERVTRERAVAYVRELQQLNASFTVTTRLDELGNMLRVMAPGFDITWLHRLAGRVRATASSVRDKRRRVKSSEQLVDLGLDLIARAEGVDGGTPLARAINYRDGLMIVMLAARPIRRRNFARLEIGRHVLKVGSAWWLRIPATETKTRRPVDVPLPEGIEPLIEHYLAHHRPLLAQRRGRWTAGGAGAALWVSKDGSAMTEMAIHHRIIRRTQARFGHVVNQHLFRDSAATSIAIDDPAHVRITAAVLGHASLATSEKYYNLAGSAEATRRLQGHVLALRKKLKPSRATRTTSRGSP